jgi:SAM-dependent methyltransferase
MSTTEFKDHFSGHAADYARFRPDYPAELFAWLADISPNRDLAWDCATGNGQAARALARHFARVIATDASDTQIASAFPHPRVEYRVAPAEASGIEAGSVALITVAQAVHWFDLPRFYAEAERVLVPGGVLAVWAYLVFKSTPEIDRVVDYLYSEVVGPYWPPDRGMIQRGYAEVQLPFEAVEPPPFVMAKPWTVEDAIGYLRTWSATRGYMAAHGTDPLEQVREELVEAWGPGERMVRWELILKVSRKEG